MTNSSSYSCGAVQAFKDALSLDTRKHLLFEHAHRIQSGAERIDR
jgi:hypothetical protein